MSWLAASSTVLKQFWMVLMRSLYYWVLRLAKINLKLLSSC
jgi:hypothetical protein